MNEAVDFFYHQCSASLLSDIAKADAGAVAPGRFRLAIQDEWSAFEAPSGNR
jgi:hypothetical protein